MFLYIYLQNITIPLQFNDQTPVQGQTKGRLDEKMGRNAEERRAKKEKAQRNETARLEEEMT